MKYKLRERKEKALGRLKDQLKKGKKVNKKITSDLTDADKKRIGEEILTLENKIK